MIDHTRYRTGRDDLKRDLRFKIQELKSSAWDLEKSEKYYTLLTIYRDIIELQDALLAILNSENEDLTWHGNNDVKL